MRFICIYHVILIAGGLHILGYVGHVGCWGVYLSALESLNVYNRNHISPEQNINKVLWPVSQRQ